MHRVGREAYRDCSDVIDTTGELNDALNNKRADVNSLKYNGELNRRL